MKRWLKILYIYGKIKITAFVAVSTGLGYILGGGRSLSEAFITIFGVFILASGSAAFNEYQERAADALMNRTKNRPLPTGELTKVQGFLIALLITLAGLLILFFESRFIPFIFGALALVWYNLIYTPLKKKTAFAVIPGAVIGAIPPIIGWTAAGGAIDNPQVWALATFFFIWQIPHFWLLALIFDKEYKKAGFPTLTGIFSQGAIQRLTFFWVALLALSSLLVPFFEISSNIYLLIFLLIAGVWLLWRTKPLLEYGIEMSGKKLFAAFMNVNFYVLEITVMLSLAKFIGL